MNAPTITNMHHNASTLSVGYSRLPIATDAVYVLIKQQSVIVT